MFPDLTRGEAGDQRHAFLQAKLFEGLAEESDEKSGWSGDGSIRGCALGGLEREELSARTAASPRSRSSVALQRSGTVNNYSSTSTSATVQNSKGHGGPEPGTTVQKLL